MKLEEEKLIELVAEHSGVDRSEVSLVSRMQADLGMDSLDHVELAISIEEHLIANGAPKSLYIPDENFDRSVTVGDLLRNVNNFLNFSGGRFTA